MTVEKTDKNKHDTTARTRPLSRLVLVCVATAIALMLYYRFGLHAPPTAPSVDNDTVVRKKISDEKPHGVPPRADFQFAVPQVPKGQAKREGRAPSRRVPVDKSQKDSLRTAEPWASRPTGESGNAPDTSSRLDRSDKPDYSDAQPPKLLAISFDPQEAPPGTNVLVYIEVTDNLSGVNAVSGKAKSPSGTAMLSFGAQKSQGGTLFVAVLEMPEKAEVGTWSMANVRVVDNVRNLKVYTQRDPVLQGAHFEIVGSDSDNAPPTIVGADLDPYEVRGGEKVHLVVEAQDDKSGVARIHGSIISPSNNARLSIACNKTDEDDVFSGYVAMPKDAESGQWTLYYLRAEDEAKNAKTYYRNNYPELFEKATVRVYADSSDSDPPALDDLSIYPAIVAYEERLEIVVTASDDVSGISRVSGRLASPSGKAHIPFSCAYQGESGTYRASVKIANNTEVGTWSVDYIRMVDKARNQAIYAHQNALVADTTFEVTGQ